MATDRWIASAAAAARPGKGPSPTFNDASGPLLANPHASEVAERRERTRAARRVVAWGRTPADPDADVLLDVLGLSHDDAAPDPTHGDGPAAADDGPQVPDERAALPALRPVAPPGRTARVCSTCGATKPLASYYRDRTDPSGRSYGCKTCRNKQRRPKTAERSPAA